MENVLDVLDLFQVHSTRINYVRNNSVQFSHLYCSHWMGGHWAPVVCGRGRQPVVGAGEHAAGRTGLPAQGLEDAPHCCNSATECCSSHLVVSEAHYSFLTWEKLTCTVLHRQHRECPLVLGISIAYKANAVSNSSREQSLFLCFYF